MIIAAPNHLTKPAKRHRPRRPPLPTGCPRIDNGRPSQIVRPWPTPVPHVRTTGSGRELRLTGGGWIRFPYSKNQQTPVVKVAPGNEVGNGGETQLDLG